MSDDGIPGQQGLTSDTSEFNKQSFLIQQAIGRYSTMKVVKVVAVSTSNEVGPVGFVDVLPLVNQIDGVGKATKHGTIFNVPYSRFQGGKNAFIMDPAVGDLGIMVCADRDISAVKESKKQANPGSFRRLDAADGVYVGGILNGAPEQYVRFTADEIEVVSTTKITIKAPVIKLDGAIEATGEITGPGGGTINLGSNVHQIAGKNFTSEGIVTGASVVGGGKVLQTHTHSGVVPGGGNSGPPV